MVENSHCAVKGCRNAFEAVKGVSFYLIPFNEKTAKQWKRNLKLTGSTYGKVVCSDHFEDKYFVLIPDTVNKRLSLDAVPLPWLLDVAESSDVSDSDASSEHEMNIKDENEVYMSLPLTNQQSCDKEADSKIKTEIPEESDVPGTFVYVDPLQIQHGRVLELRDKETDKQKVGFNVCRACLSCGPSLGTLPRALRGTYWSLCDARDAARTRPALCALCRRLLHNAHRFREQCRTADALIRRLHVTNQFSPDIISDDIRSSLNPISHFTIERNVVESKFNITHESDDDDAPVVVKMVTKEVKHEPEVKKNVQETEKVLEIDKKIQPESNDANECDSDSDFNDDLPLAIPETKKVILKKENNSTNPPAEKSAKNNSPKRRTAPKKVPTERRTNSDCNKNAIPKATVARKRNKPTKCEKADKLDKNAIKKTTVSRKKNKPQTNATIDNMNLKKYMKITSLTLAEQIQALVQKKDSYAFEKAEYKCDICFRTFRVKSGYESHMYRHTDKFGKHTCAVCQLHFRLKHKLKAHLNIHMYKFNCKQCAFKSHFRNASVSHIATHQGKQYTCKICKESFDHKSTYMGHVRRQHPASHPCQLCGYAFISEYGLKLHNRMVHRMDEDIIPEDGPLCTQCNTRFIDETAYAKHMKVSACASKGQRRAFRRRGKNEKKTSKCDLCSRVFETFVAYQLHYSRDHPNETNVPKQKRINCVLCDQCGRMFTCASILEDHMSVHAEDGKKSHKCDQCGRCYITKVSLKLHQYTHSGLRYPCEVCGKEFTKQNNRDRHLVYAHTADKNEKCEICDKAFKTKDRKNAHMAHVHLNRPYPKRDRKSERERRQKQMKEE